jgi:hypothetical protein
MNPYGAVVTANGPQGKRESVVEEKGRALGKAEGSKGQAVMPAP